MELLDLETGMELLGRQRPLVRAPQKEKLKGGLCKGLKFLAAK
jgi:hypothetical protein